MVLHNRSDLYEAITATDEALIIELFQQQMIKFGKFSLKSGKESYVYVDIRTVISSPQLFGNICACFLQLMSGLKYDFICGIPYSALTFASAIAYSQKTPMLLKRKEAKDYGTKKIIEGDFRAGQTCILIEDVVTTGGSLFDTIRVLEDSGLVVKDICILIERNQGGREALELAGYKVHTKFDLYQILEVLYRNNLITIDDKKAAIDSILNRL